MDDVSWQFYPLPLLHKCTYISTEYTYSWTKLLLSCLGIVLQYYSSWGKYSINLFCADVPNYFITFLLFYSECFPVLSNKFTELNGNIITKWIDQKQPSRGVLRKCVLKICSKFTGEHPCRSVISKKMQSNFGNFVQWCRSGVFIVNFEHITHLVLEFLLLTLNM